MQSMDNVFVSGRKDDRGKEDSLRSLEDKKDASGDYGMNSSEIKTKRLVSLVDMHHALVSNFRRIQAGKSPINDSLFRVVFGIGNKIPRHVVTLDEKYLRGCLELIHINAAKAAQYSFSVNLSSVKIDIVSNGLNSAIVGDENMCDFSRFVSENPLEVGTGSLVIGSAESWIVGSIMGSRSMKNILNSPLLEKLGAFDVDPSLNDGKGLINYDFMSSSGGFRNYTSYELGSETAILDNHKYGSEINCKRLVSMSSTVSTCSDQSFSSPTTISQGMLQCTWKGGTPCFVFSVDNQREVYVASLSKEGAARNKGLDYVYLFYSSKSSHKEHRISDNEPHLVGKMSVSTSFSVCSQDSKIKETQFVLFSGNKASIRGMQTSSDHHRKYKGISKKVVKALKSSHSLKQRTVPRFHQSSSIMEDSSSDPCRDTANKSDALDQTNLELTAIVVTDHFPENPRGKVGGWGLKFLKKPAVVRKPNSLETPVRSVCSCSCSTSDCSTSMNVLIPAGIHGCPRTRNGGPSSLIERWRSGGHCDCGGWDLGCPLSVLKPMSSKGGSPPTDKPKTCKLMDFSIQGSKHGSPSLTILNIRDDRYFIRFQSTLSALQSFSIAVAYIHTQSPTLRPGSIQLSRLQKPRVEVF